LGRGECTSSQSGCGNYHLKKVIMFEGTDVQATYGGKTSQL